MSSMRAVKLSMTMVVSLTATLGCRRRTGIHYTVRLVAQVPQCSKYTAGAQAQTRVGRQTPVVRSSIVDSRKRSAAYDQSGTTGSTPARPRPDRS